MEPNYLDELKKLKEQKDADLSKSQPYNSPSIPDFEETAPAQAPAEPEAPSDETIKFEPVTAPSDERPAPVAGRRARRPSPEEIARRKRKKKIKLAVIISVIALAVVLAALVIVFFVVKSSNQDKITYDYWGMGLNIENGVKEFDFFGNITSITRYDQTGLPQQVAEFEDGRCVKESFYDPEGNVKYYYTHEYKEDGTRSISSYFEDGKMIYSERYTVQSETVVRADRTYHQEENRIENATITLSEGRIYLREVFENSVLAKRETFSGDLITQIEEFDTDGILSRRTVREFNVAKKLMLSEVVYDGNSVTLSRTVNEYDEKTDLLKKSIRYDGFGEIIDFDTYNYDLNNNPIKQVRYAKDGSIQEQIVRVFNDKNKITKETYIGPDGSTTRSIGYEYDANGFIAKSIDYDPVTSSVLRYSVYTRTAAGAVTQLEVYNANSIQTEKTVYNTAGFITEHYKYNDYGILLNVEKYKYDGRQNLINKESSTYAEDTTLLLYLNEQYDEKGQVTVYTIDDTVANRHEQVICVYDAEGNLSKQTIFDKSGKALREETLDAEGKILKELLYEDGREAELNEFTYDEEGRVLLKKVTNRKTGVLTHYAYTYDKDGEVLSALISDAQNRPIQKLEYDVNGLIGVETNYNQDGTVSGSKHKEYDEQERVIVQEVRDAEDKTVSKIVYYYRTDGSYDYTEYDGDGKVIADSRGDQYVDDKDNTNSDNGDNTSSSDASEGVTDNPDVPTDTGTPTDGTEQNETDSQAA